MKQNRNSVRIYIYIHIYIEFLATVREIPKLEKNLALKFTVKQTTRNYLRILKGILELVKVEMQYRSRSIPLIFTGVSSSSIISPLTTCPR